MADLVRGRLADYEMGVIRRRIPGNIGMDQLLLVRAAGLAPVQGDEHGDLGIQRLRHQDTVELVVVIPEHVEIQGDADSGENMLEDVVDVVTAHVEEMEISARGVRVRLFPGVLLQVEQVKRLQAL